MLHGAGRLIARQRCIACGVLVLLVAGDLLAQPKIVKQPFKFIGRDVTVTAPEVIEEGGTFPKGPAASICIEGPPQQQCYTAYNEENSVFDYGINPTVRVIRVDKYTSALLFSATSGGVSGTATRFVLLRPGSGTELRNLFPDISISDLSQQTLWNNASISDAPIFLTAEELYGPDETHHSPHRYKISAYIRRRSPSPEDSFYFLADQFMTTRKYLIEPEGGKVNILNSEKQEILARLRRVKAESRR